MTESNHGIELEKHQEEFEELTSLTGNEPSLMDEVLMHQPKETQRDVRKLVEMSGMDQEDPYFLILLSCRIIQILLQNAPGDLEKSVDQSRLEIVKTFDSYIEKLRDSQDEIFRQHSQTALDQSIAKVNNAIAKTLEDNNIEIKKGKFTPRVWGGIISSAAAAIALSVGFVGGWSFDKAVLAKTNTVNLSPEQEVLLKWAESKEGKFSKKILEWNEDLIGQECQKKVSDLNVTIKLGTAEATSGYCWVWTEPPGKRNFTSSN